MTSIMTRLQVGDYETWKAMFDQDAPRTRESARGLRLYRGLEDPNEVFIQVDFASREDAAEARERLLASGVLDRFQDKNGPTLVEQAETIDRDQTSNRTMTKAAASDAVLDFNPTVGMVVEGPPPEDPEADPWQVEMVFAPGFAGPPVHAHPHQQESYEVLSGVLDVFLDGQWRALGPGDKLTIPAGVAHTIRNLHETEMRALNVHDPALDFPRYMAGLHQLVHSGKVRTLPPKDPRSVIYLSMLFTANGRTLASVKPPQSLMRILAFIGRRLGYELPTATM